VKDMMLVLSLTCFAIGIYLIRSGFLLMLEEAESKSGIWKDILVIIFDLITNPITSEGFRIFFGGVFIVIGILIFII
jgi:hypothetical protein